MSQRVGLKSSHGAAVQDVLDQLLQLCRRVGSRVIKVRDDSRIDFGAVGEADHIGGLIERERRHRVWGLNDYGSAEELSRGLGGLLGRKEIRGQRLLDHLAGTVAGKDVLGRVGEVGIGPKGILCGNVGSREVGRRRRVVATVSALALRPVVSWAATGAAVGVAASQPADATPDLVGGGRLVSQETAGKRQRVVPLWRCLAAALTAGFGPDWLLNSVRKSAARAGSAVAAGVSELRRMAGGVYTARDVVLNVGMT